MRAALRTTARRRGPPARDDDQGPAPASDKRYIYTKRSRYAQVCASWDNKGSLNKNWEILFKKIDADFSGRLDYPEFVKAVREELKVPDTTD